MLPYRLVLGSTLVLTLAKYICCALRIAKTAGLHMQANLVGSLLTRSRTIMHHVSAR